MSWIRDLEIRGIKRAALNIVLFEAGVAEGIYDIETQSFSLALDHGKRSSPFLRYLEKHFARALNCYMRVCFTPSFLVLR